jgi:hypothetical protein
MDGDPGTLASWRRCRTRKVLGTIASVIHALLLLGVLCGRIGCGRRWPGREAPASSMTRSGCWAVGLGARMHLPLAAYVGLFHGQTQHVAAHVSSLPLAGEVGGHTPGHGRPGDFSMPRRQPSAGGGYPRRRKRLSWASAGDRALLAGKAVGDAAALLPKKLLGGAHEGQRGLQYTSYLKYVKYI